MSVKIQVISFPHFFTFCLAVGRRSNRKKGKPRLGPTLTTMTTWCRSTGKNEANNDDADDDVVPLDR